MWERKERGITAGKRGRGTLLVNEGKERGDRGGGKEGVKNEGSRRRKWGMKYM